MVVLDYSENAGDENKENINKVNEGFISMKGNLSILKRSREKSFKKTTLNGWMSLIENFRENLGINLKSFKNLCPFPKLDINLRPYMKIFLKI